MTDIVEQLRDLFPHLLDDAYRTVVWDAVTEIEQLREALAALNLAYMGVPFQATATQLAAMQVASEMARAALARKP